MREYEIYQNLKMKQTTKIINDTVEQYKLPNSWKAPKVRTKMELAAHIELLCNELGFIVNDCGTLFRRYQTK